MTTSQNARTFFLLATVAAIGGCAQPVKDVLNNRDAFLVQNFAPASLPSNVQARLKPAIAVAPIAAMHIEYGVTREEEGRVDQLEASMEQRHLNDGYVQRRYDVSKNGIPYRVNFELSYGGIYMLKTQAAFTQNLNAQRATEVKEITRIDGNILAIEPERTYLLNTKVGLGIQAFNFRDSSTSCKAGTSFLAAKVHASLTGDAIPVECEIKNDNNVLDSRLSYVWLRDQRVALIVQTVDSKTKSDYIVKQISVTR